MKKAVDTMLWIFGVGVMVCLFAGGLAFLGFGVALCIGGEAATATCVFIHKTYFPYVIRFTSVFVGIGLLGMYLGRVKALSLRAKSNKGFDTTDTKDD